MRFKAKINRIFLVCWSIFMVCMGARMMVTWHQYNYIKYRIPIHYGVFDVLFWLSLLAICLLAISFRLPQYCEMRDAGLFLRRGWKINFIPYSSFDSLSPISRKIDLFSPTHLLVMLDKGTIYMIAVADYARFLAEIAIRCPYLEHSGTGSGISLKRNDFLNSPNDTRS